MSFCHSMVIPILNDFGMKEMMLEWLFSSWDDSWMTEMRVEWGNFWSKANALDFYLYHSILILTILCHLTLIHCLKWTWNDFQSFHTLLCTIRISSHHLSVLPSFRCNFNVILSFCWHSIIQDSFQCYPIILMSFYSHSSQSTVIRTFPLIPVSFHHSRLIPLPFCHSCVHHSEVVQCHLLL